MLTPQVEETLQKHAGTIRRFARQQDVVMNVAPLLADEVQQLLNDVKRSDAETTKRLGEVEAEKQARVAELQEKLRKQEAEAFLKIGAAQTKSAMLEAQVVQMAEKLGTVCKRCQKKVGFTVAEEVAEPEDACEKVLKNLTRS